MSDEIQVIPEPVDAVEVESTHQGESEPESTEPEAKEPEEAKKPEAKDEKTEAEKRAERKEYNQRKAWERLVEEKAMLKAKVELYEQQQKQQHQTPTAAPKRADYGSDEEYVQALTDYTVQNKLSSVKEELSRTQSTQKVQESWSSKISKAAQTYPDYQEVLAEAQDVPINPEVADELMASELGGDITYYLAKHPDEVEQLNRMDSRSIARYIGRLEEKIERERSNSVKAKTSKAPAPIKPVSGTSSPSMKSLEDMSMEEYVKYMDKQDAAKRKRN